MDHASDEQLVNLATGQKSENVSVEEILLQGQQVPENVVLSDSLPLEHLYFATSVPVSTMSSPDNQFHSNTQNAVLEQLSAMTFNSEYESLETLDRSSVARQLQVIQAQIVSPIKMISAQGKEQITVKLQPDHLGSLEIEVAQEHDENMTVILRMENKETYTLLQSDSAGLIRQLHGVGIEVTESDISYQLFHDHQRSKGGQGYLSDWLNSHNEFDEGIVDGQDTMPVVRKYNDNGLYSLEV